MLSWLRRLLYGRPLACGCCYEPRFCPLSPPCDRMKELINDACYMTGKPPVYLADGSYRVKVRESERRDEDYTVPVIF